MPRIARGLVDNFIYHILNRGNNKNKIFHKQQDYQAFLNLMIEAKKQYPIKIFAYCLMPNHFHLVVMPNKAEDLSKWMQWLMTSHVRRYHKHYGTTGHIWQGRFKSFIIQNDAHLITVLRYAEANPVRSKLVKSAEGWRWSSHGEMLGENKRRLINKAPIELPDNWNKYVNYGAEENLEKIRQSIKRQSPYGDTEWQSAICKQLGLESTVRSIGRPKTIK
ncbi:MAG TPA: transposase [Candidatus Omnitrophica bacterium]|nr:transposase [Candidatus Omnitrophota bacterium]